MQRGILLAVTLAVVAGTMAAGPAGEFRRPGSALPAATGAATTTDAADNDSTVRFVVRYPTDDGYRNETVLTREQFLTVSDVFEYDVGGAYFALTLTEEGARQFVERLRGTGITTRGIDDCRWSVREGYCLLLVSRGRVVYASGLTADLARQVETGAFVDRPRFRLNADNESEARSLRRALLGRPTATETTATDGGTGPLERLPPSALLIGAGLVVLLSVLVLSGRRSDESAADERDPPR